MKLDPGASHSLELDPKPLFISTSVMVTRGERYRLGAEGKWKDGRIVCGANGWNRFGIGWLRKKNRLPNENWFVLVATVGETLTTARKIGLSAEIDIGAGDCPNNQSEQLFVFANDWPSRYENNKIASAEEGGPMRLTITRLA